MNENTSSLFSETHVNENTSSLFSETHVNENTDKNWNDCTSPFLFLKKNTDKKWNDCEILKENTDKKWNDCVSSSNSAPYYTETEEIQSNIFLSTHNCYNKKTYTDSSLYSGTYVKENTEKNQSFSVDSLLFSETYVKENTSSLYSGTYVKENTFKSLIPIESLTHDVLNGPTLESNWVVPGILMAGAFPATSNDEETFKLITSILKCGITKFVCLQKEYYPNITEYNWRNNKGIRPYFEDVKRIVSNKDSFETLAEFTNIVTPDKLSFEHCPIIDCGITEDFHIISLAKKLVQSIIEGDILYIHCWGGHGRTGTLISIMLHIMYGMSAEDAMKYCNAVHAFRSGGIAIDLSTNLPVTSPQTKIQQTQVIRSIDYLMSEL